MNMTNPDGVPTLVLGLGNELLGDEGFGVHVARELKKIELPRHVRVAEGGVGGFNLLGQLEGVARLLVVDVMITDSPPGELRLFRPGEKLSEPDKQIISFHQMGALELVRMWSLLEQEPEVWFLVTRPEKMTWDTELSPKLQLAARQAVELIAELCRGDFHSAGAKIRVNCLISDYRYFPVHCWQDNLFSHQRLESIIIGINGYGSITQYCLGRVVATVINSCLFASRGYRT